MKEYDEKLSQQRIASGAEPQFVVNLPSIIFPKKQLVNFTDTHLIGFGNDDDERKYGYQRLDSTQLKYPVSMQMIIEFIQLNRHLIKHEKEAHLSINYDGLKDEEKECNYPPLPLEETISMMMKDDISLYEFDDRFANSELIYGILVNK